MHNHVCESVFAAVRRELESEVRSCGQWVPDVALRLESLLLSHAWAFRQCGPVGSVYYAVVTEFACEYGRSCDDRAWREAVCNQIEADMEKLVQVCRACLALSAGTIPLSRNPAQAWMNHTFTRTPFTTHEYSLLREACARSIKSVRTLTTLRPDAA